MPKAEMAAKGEGEFAVGDWCRFCKAKNTCRARAEEYLRLAQMEFKPPELLSEEEIAEVLKVADELAKWSADVYAYSLSAQVSFYSSLIQGNPEWEYAGVYVDSGVSGTSMAGRTEFKRLLADCEAGRVNIILTKSISRFARNTVDLLETVRHLKELGVEVRFEKENINSLSEDGELMLTLLASFAQEESRSISENAKWAIRKQYKQGKPRNGILYGYRIEKGQPAIEPEEAEVVRMIFDLYLEGMSCYAIANELNAKGIPSYYGKKWAGGVICQAIRQEKYTGNTLLQKFYVEEGSPRKGKRNNGELPMYYTDEGISATGIAKREGFRKMVEDALAGSIDLIVTKSVSRFARNTVDSLSTIRKLKEKGCECYFEKKDFYTGKVPKDVVKSAFFGTFWCLCGV